MCIYWASEVTIETGILVWKTGKDLILKFKKDATVIKQIKDRMGTYSLFVGFAFHWWSNPHKPEVPFFLTF